MLALAFEPIGGQTTESVTHGQCDARPTVTFPAADHRRPLAGTKLYCLVTEAHGCEQLAQSCYPATERPGVEPATSWSQVQRPNNHTTESLILRRVLRQTVPQCRGHTLQQYTPWCSFPPKQKFRENFGELGINCLVYTLMVYKSPKNLLNSIRGLKSKCNFCVSATILFLQTDAAEAWEQQISGKVEWRSEYVWQFTTCYEHRQKS